jgi:hypothetical protein
MVGVLVLRLRHRARVYDQNSSWCHMPKKSIKIKNKRFTIHEVPIPADAVDDLIELGYRRPFADSQALLNVPFSKIILKDTLKGKEKDSTIFHEVVHAVLPKLSEHDVLVLERDLFPILHRYGLRFKK